MILGGSVGLDVVRVVVSSTDKDIYGELGSGYYERVEL